MSNAPAVVVRHDALTLTLANGANNNVAIPTRGRYFEIAGPTGSFSLSGLAAVGGNIDGREVEIANFIAQQFTLTNAATSSAANQLLTLTGADIVKAGIAAVKLRYSASQTKWVVCNHQGS